MAEKLIPIEHPGIFLKEEFMEPLEVSAYKVAKDTNISSMAISEILRGKRNITPRVGIRLSKYFGVSEGYFSRLQLQYDLDIIKKKEGKEVKKIHRLKSVEHHLNAKVL
jgi:addiction module HigA family antidote